MAVVEEVKFQRKKKGKSFLQKAKKFGKQGQRGRGSQIAQVIRLSGIAVSWARAWMAKSLFCQDQYDYLVRVMERWREPWESEEEKEIFVSNVMQQVKALKIQMIGV